MNLCEDCQINRCGDCYESDCDCNLASHTLCAAILLKDAVLTLNPDAPTDIQAGAILTDKTADDRAEFNLLINDRTYHITIKA